MTGAIIACAADVAHPAVKRPRPFACRWRLRLPLAVVGWLVLVNPSFAQVYESVGSRALGMGGAFVAVADDSTASWWNPAGLAAGPFLDLAIGGGSRARWVSAGIPPLGIAYYRFEPARNPTADSPADRKDDGQGGAVRASQFGATLVQTLVDGVHVGLTAKYVSGGAPDAREGTGDIDAGVIAVLGAVRVGAAVRNLRAPVLGGVRLDRQIRLGAAFDVDRAMDIPAMIAVDVDLRRYEAPDGERRVIAAGAEHWLRDRRVGLRAGARINTVGTTGKAFTAGVSAAVRAGLYLDAHAAAGSAGERGWSVAGRVSF
jgi:hypothetical protein